MTETKENIISEIEEYFALPERIRTLCAKINAKGKSTQRIVGDEDYAELGRLEHIKSVINNKYSDILEELGIVQNVDTNDLWDFMLFARELFNRAKKQ
jgi:hypothetical protein